MKKRRIAKLLIANRGEIVVRIVRTCRALGVESVAVYTAAEVDAVHTKCADEALELPGTGVAAYLDEKALIASAIACGADAIHPGFGFLSERESFAKAVIDAGLIFVGPRPEAIAAMGDKLESKEHAAKAGVPTVPSFAPEKKGDDVPAKWNAAAKEIGYPVLLKASAGGGGKGMRVVASEKDLEESLASCRREAKASFGNDTVLMEKYLEGARHVEVQVFGDQHGNVVTLLERDCSLQRRHQKVLEECPAPNLSDATRTTLHESAKKLASAIGYDNAGTVECLVDAKGAVYFLEMNTRLQVEHPVTEMVCGVDLVRWQLAVAEGAKVPVQPVTPKGHAVEVRLYAEDPARGFLPATGTIVRWLPPPNEPGIRWDGAVTDGTVVAIDFDPMLGKVIAWGETREDALRLLRRALRKTSVLGLTTNRDFLARLVAAPEVVEAKVSTQLLGAIAPRLTAAEDTAGPEFATAFAAWKAERPAFVPEGIPLGYRNNPFRYPSRKWSAGGTERTVSYFRKSNTVLGIFDATGKEQRWELVSDDGAGSARVAIDGRQRDVRYARRDNSWWFATDDYSIGVTECDPFPRKVKEVGDAVLAPMAGRVTKRLVKSGSSVKSGAPLFVLEAMKMEQTVYAPREGVVAAVLVTENQAVEMGARLLDWEV